MAMTTIGKTKMEKKAILRHALKVNGINPDFSKWKDHQKLGQAVHEALK